MARPQKEGLDYFPLDVDIDQDDKVAIIEAKHGLHGFSIIVKLLMKIYKEGYYYTWTEREQLLFLKKVNVDQNMVNDIINDCLKWGFFDKEIFEKYQILTSLGIQKRYLEAVKRRKQITMVGEYALIDPDEYLKKQNQTILLVCKHNNQVNVSKNSVNVDINPQRKVKKSKEKKSKEDVATKIQYAEFVSMTEDQYKKLVDKYGLENTKSFIEKLNNSKGANDKLKYSSDYHAILKWVIDAVLNKPTPKQPQATSSNGNTDLNTLLYNQKAVITDEDSPFNKSDLERGS